MKAAPEGVAMANKRKRLSDLCKKYDVPSTVENALNYQVENLATFKNVILPNTKTQTQRAHNFLKIESYIDKLKAEIEALTWEDRNSLDDEFFGVSKPGFFESLDPVNDCQEFDIAGSVLPRLKRASMASRDRLQNVSKSGRADMTVRQADFIRCIAQALMRANIAPSYSGKFYEICNAIYEAAGLTLPDRAIRYFMTKLRPKLKSSGYCL